MNILFASSEVVPFAKTGGLADVCGALPIALNKLGHKSAIIMPAYGCVHDAGVELQATNVQLSIPIGNKIVHGSILKGHLPESDVDVYFVQQDEYFRRNELYREHGSDYKDNCERFVFFSRAVMDAIRQLDLHVDILHCNDWQTGLIPALLQAEYAQVPGYEQIASVMTIHNMAYQGRFWHWDMLLTGLDWKYFNWQQMEFYGDLNLLKTGISFADTVTTVSQRYAEEIQSAPLGCGLEGALQQRSSDLSGIINGVSYDEWNPETDKFLAANFSLGDWKTGKAKCKADLQQELGLPQDPHVPLIGLVGRLADQKGWDLILHVMSQWAQSVNAQWAILGTGEPHFHDALNDLANSFPNRVGLSLQFSNALAHKVEAGSDMFLMPSQYEPCGLNQLYSLKYGTIPVVRETGGLADTIVDASPETLGNGTANGFSFQDYDTHSLSETLHRACNTYTGDWASWEQLIKNAMSQDWSWDTSAQNYVSLYEKTLANKAQQRERLEQTS